MNRVRFIRGPKGSRWRENAHEGATGIEVCGRWRRVQVTTRIMERERDKMVAGDVKKI